MGRTGPGRSLGDGPNLRARRRRGRFLQGRGAPPSLSRARLGAPPTQSSAAPEVIVDATSVD